MQWFSYGSRRSWSVHIQTRYFLVFLHALSVRDAQNFQVSYAACNTADQKIKKKVPAKELMKSNKSIFFPEIAFLAVLKIFPSSKTDFWPFWKLPKIEFGQKKFVKLIYLIFELTNFDK